MITEPNIKINLGLNILYKRDDGFHELESLFIPVFSFKDRLEIVLDEDDFTLVSSKQNCSTSGNDKLSISIYSDTPIDWNPLSDLVVKAYNILDEDYNLGRVKILLEKNIPVGAGLGGGSSDAAFALIMLNSLFNLNLSLAQLAKYASKIGSDCAFFVYNKPMIGRGRGEILEEFAIDLSSYNIKIYIPKGISVNTAQAYKGLILVPHNLSIVDALSHPVEAWKDVLINDFESSVFQKYPQLSKIKEDIYKDGAIYASMSGSGSAMFGLFKI